MKNKWILFAIALPFVVICLLIVRAEYHLKSGEQWSFELRGYDPRDLLRGHYLQFNILYDWERGKNECNSGSDCCLCLTKTEARVPKVHLATCPTARSQCDGYILNSEKNALNRFYIPEASAKRAEKLLREARARQDAYLNVSINQKGEPAILDLIVNGQSLGKLLQTEEETP